GGRAKCAFGRHPPDDPVGPPAAGAVIDLMLAVHRVIAPFVGPAHLAQGRVHRHIVLPFAMGPTSEAAWGCTKPAYSRTIRLFRDEMVSAAARPSGGVPG